MERQDAINLNSMFDHYILMETGSQVNDDSLRVAFRNEVGGDGTPDCYRQYRQSDRHCTGLESRDRIGFT